MDTQEQADAPAGVPAFTPAGAGARKRVAAVLAALAVIAVALAVNHWSAMAAADRVAAGSLEAAQARLLILDEMNAACFSPSVGGAPQQTVCMLEFIAHLLAVAGLIPG